MTSTLFVHCNTNTQVTAAPAYRLVRQDSARSPFRGYSTLKTACDTGMLQDCLRRRHLTLDMPLTQQTDQAHQVSVLECRMSAVFSLRACRSMAEFEVREPVLLGVASNVTAAKSN